MSGKHRREHLRRARRELDAIAEYPSVDIEETLALADDMHVTSQRGEWERGEME